MKALGLRLLDQICYLEQLNVLRHDERVEYANLVGLAMTPGYEHYFGILRGKLEEKANASTGSTADLLENTLAAFEQGTA